MGELLKSELLIHVDKIYTASSLSNAITEKCRIFID